MADNAKTIQIPCEQCGEVFKARVYPHKGTDIPGYTDKVCGKACKAARRADKIEIVKCHCGTEIIAYKSEHRVTCSRSCKLKRQYNIKH